MNKAILLSVRPEWVAKILNGEKTAELRKSVPQGFAGWVYIYCTKGKPYLLHDPIDNGVKGSYVLSKNYDLPFMLNAYVVARFWFDEYRQYGLFVDNKVGFSEDSCEYLMDFKELESLCLDDESVSVYGKGKDLYIWHIKRLEILDTPMELREFTLQKIVYYGDNDESHISFFSLTKAPQSWQYVWVKE